MLNGALLGLTREKTPSGHLPIAINRDAHFLLVAGTGSGKSRSVAMVNIIRNCGSMVILDFGGTLATETALWRQQAMGNEVRIIDPFRVVKPEFVPKENGVPCYGSVNGIDIVRSSQSPLTTARAISQSFIPPGGALKDSHWSDAAELRMAATIMFVAFDPAIDELGLPRDMETVWKCLSDPKLEKTSLEYMMVSDDPFIADQAAAFYKASKSNTEIQSIRNQIRVNCAGSFAERCILDTMLDTNIEFSEINQRPMTICLVLPVWAASSHFRVLRYFLSLAISEIEQAGPRSHDSIQQPTLFIMDEFPVLKNFPIVVDAMATMRKYGAKFLIMVQNLSQLKDVYGEGWRKITGNCDVIQYFGGTNDTFTAEELSKMCGTGTVPGESETQNNKSGSSQTSSDTGRPVYTPDEIMRLPLPEQIIKITGLNPMREIRFATSLISFPDYLAFMKAVKAGWELWQAVIEAKRNSWSYTYRKDQ